MAQRMTVAGIKEQYQKYPYPARNPEDERSRLIAVPVVDLRKINKSFWSNKKKFDGNFRILDAGCGTGDAVIYLAEQLKHTNSKIVALDFSKTSLEIVEERARTRNLKNIAFVQSPIEHIPKLNLGKFDLIICTGVLHHLPDPQPALRILTNSLKEDGLIIVMLYGKYGRMAIYMLQELLKRTNADETDKQKKIQNAREVLKNLSKSHWFKFSESVFRDERKDDGQLYDLLLHESDRPYTVPEIYELLDSAGLELIQFANKKQYETSTYIQGRLRAKIKNLSKKEQEAIAELLNSRMIMHTFIAQKISQ